MINAPPTSRVYIDANPFMYLVEGSEGEAAPIKELFACLSLRHGFAVTSELTLAEVMARANLADHRRTYFDLVVLSEMFDLRPVSRDILIETAAYRRASVVREASGKESMVKLPDAIHIVTAIRGGCTHVLSNDGRLRLPAGMMLVRPDAAGIGPLIRELS